MFQTKQKQDKLNRIAIKEFKKYAKEAGIIPRIDLAYAYEDELGLLCIKHCSDCGKFHVCRECETEEDRIACRTYQQPPDYNDPYGPDPNSEKIVYCLHCGDEYKEKEIKWDPRLGIWKCKNLDCNGGGLGFDIFYKDQMEENE